MGNIIPEVRYVFNDRKKLLKPLATSEWQIRRNIAWFIKKAPA